MILAFLPAHPRGSGTSGRSRSGRTRCASSPGSWSRCWSPGGGGAPGAAARRLIDVAIWAVPFGIVGGRLYHVDHRPGAVLRRRPAADPGPLHLGRRPGHLGRGRARRGRRLDRLPPPRHQRSPPSPTPSPPGWSSPRRSAAGATTSTRNCSARPTNLPWALLIDPAHRPAGHPRRRPYHPTFLYESLWDLGVAVLCLGGPALPAAPRPAVRLYVPAYTVGRAWIEALRVDHANHFLGLRLNTGRPGGVPRRRRRPRPAQATPRRLLPIPPRHPPTPTDTPWPG